MKSIISKTVPVVILAAAMSLGPCAVAADAQAASAGSAVAAPGAAAAAHKPQMTVTPMGTGINSSHFQEMIQLTCAGNGCTGDFGKAPRGSQLNITRVACDTETYDTGASFQSAYLDLYIRGNLVVVLPLPGGSASPNGVFLLNQAVDLLLTEKGDLQVFTNLANGSPWGATCTISGTLYSLEN